LTHNDSSSGYSRLGLRVASSILHGRKADCALTNNDRICAATPKGVITWGDLLAILLFSNQVLILNAPRADLGQIVAFTVSSRDADAIGTISSLVLTVDLATGLTEKGCILNSTLVDSNSTFITQSTNLGFLLWRQSTFWFG
jgi:hypothetical protein